MARTWINTNRGQGNVTKYSASELAEGDQVITPNGNHQFYRVLDVNDDMTLTIDGAKSLPGDECNVLIQATGAAVISIAGDAAAGSISVGAGGVGAMKLVNGGPNGASFFISYVPLS